MSTKFFLNRTIGNVTAILFGSYATFMAVIAALNERFLTTLPTTVTIYVITLFIWLAATRGVFITIEDGSLSVTRFFLKGKKNPLADVESVAQRPIFGGVMTEVYMKVRRPDGTFREQGLINKPGLSESEYQRLFDKIISINPNIKIDPKLIAE